MLLPLPSVVEPIEPSELEEVLYQCKNRKHSGVDKIDIEMIKCSSSDVKVRCLYLLNNCWQSKYIAENWKEVRIILIFKKGNRSKSENYRGISLIKDL
jgi:hypothetical protein